MRLLYPPWCLLYKDAFKFPSQYRVKDKQTWISWLNSSKSARIWRQKAKRRPGAKEFIAFQQHVLQTTYRHAKIVNVFLPRFSRFFCLLSSNILKIICLTCIWSKFVDTSFHPSQNPQQNCSRRDRHFYQIWKSLREAQNSLGTGTRHIQLPVGQI